MDEALFEVMAGGFEVLESRTDEQLRWLLVHAGWPAPENRLDAVMENMKRVFGRESVVEWLERCAEMGLVT